MIEEVEFRSQGALLRGLMFRPDSESSPPLVIMAHGTSATIRIVADEYAEVFRRSGLAVLLYDHRNLGGSGGRPRQEINPWIQCRGYLDGSTSHRPSRASTATASRSGETATPAVR